MIVSDICYVANVGDSRGIMSYNKGKKIYALSKDHKPSKSSEQKRIRRAGGKIYVAKSNPSDTSPFGPHRVLPGRLSVSRTFGDIAAKKQSEGGNPNVIIATPEIRSFRITQECDYLLIASDGVWDKLTNKEVS